MFSPRKPAPEPLANKLHHHSMARQYVNADKKDWPLFPSDYQGAGSGVVYITRTQVTDQRLSGSFPFWVPNGII